MVKLVHGVGINDVDYQVHKYETLIDENGKKKRKQIWVCPFYQTWKDMLQRCYCEKYQNRYITYKGCSVYSDWISLSKFKSWMEKQDWKGKQLDKDLLIEGNKVYSPDNCVFVSQTTNKFLNDNRAKRGEWPLGVYYNKCAKKFQAQCKNSFTGKNEYLGLFIDPDEAHLVWKKRKYDLACLLAEQETDERIKMALLTRYL